MPFTTDSNLFLIEFKVGKNEFVEITSTNVFYMVGFAGFSKSFRFIFTGFVTTGKFICIWTMLKILPMKNIIYFPSKVNMLVPLLVRCSLDLFKYCGFILLPWSIK